VDNSKRIRTLLNIEESKPEYSSNQSGKITAWKDEKGVLHRKDAPALTTESHMDGHSFFVEEYYLNGIQHRADGPARILKMDGKVERLEFWVNGKRHNEHGPAVVMVQEKTARYYSFGIQLSEEEFFLKYPNAKK
jgi:hypothetical protein